MQKSPSGHHCTTLSGYIFPTKACIDNQKKNLLSINISSTCPHNMVNIGLLAAKIVSLVWGTPANFNGFHVLASLLQQRHSTEANQTFHGVWPSPGLVHYIYIIGGSCPVTEFCQAQNSLCFIQVLHSCILVALQHGTWAVGANEALPHWTQGATYIRQGDWNILVLFILCCSTFLLRGECVLLLC